MYPLIPQKLWKIDDSTAGDHYWLEDSDQCHCIWEYAPRKGYAFSPANSFVWNLKIKPGTIEPLGAPTRPVIVIVDDLLNSGKHFKVTKSLILERYPSAEVRGIFLARCVREAVTSLP